MLTRLRHVLRQAESLVASAQLRVVGDRPQALCLLFHSLFRDESEIEQNVVLPLQRTTVQTFEACLSHFAQNGYRFISPDQLISGIDPAGRYALITFDDGYFNNTLALPVLQKFGAPAIFFISTNYVRDNKCFWWDVQYRKRFAEGMPVERIAEEGRELKKLTTEGIEEILLQRYGSDAFQPIGDIDRPFNFGELAEFASHPLVRLGNHTANHAILTNYDTAGMASQLNAAADALEQMTGSRPSLFAYPNGNFSPSVVEAVRAAGLRGAFTVEARPFEADHPFEIGRFWLQGNHQIDAQCRTFRAGIQLEDSARRIYRQWRDRG